MKSQTDLIIGIVSIVLACIIAGVAFGTQMKPVAPAAAPQPKLSPPTLPANVQVVRANSLPGGGGGGVGGGMGRGPGPALMGGGFGAPGMGIPGGRAGMPQPGGGQPRGMFEGAASAGGR